jgi:putative acetyltransferase
MPRHRIEESIEINAPGNAESLNSGGIEARKMVIRVEQPGDVLAIHAIHAASFPTDAEARLVDLLRAAGRLSVSLVAEVDGALIGHVAFSPVTISQGDTGAGLAPVAVVASHRCRGVAAELIRTGLEACRASDFGWAVVLGDPAYYARFGFRAASEFGLTDEYGGGPAFQCLELISGALPIGVGLVRYAPEFASLE